MSSGAYEMTNAAVSLDTKALTFGTALTVDQTVTGVLAELEEAELSLHAENTEPRGRIRIDLPAAFGRLQALPVVLTFVQQHPQLQPHISFSDRFIDPVEEGVDIVVRVGGPDVWPAAWGHRYLGSERCAAAETWQVSIPAR